MGEEEGGKVEENNQSIDAVVESGEGQKQEQQKLSRKGIQKQGISSDLSSSSLFRDTMNSSMRSLFKRSRGGTSISQKYSAKLKPTDEEKGNDGSDEEEVDTSRMAGQQEVGKEKDKDYLDSTAAAGDDDNDEDDDDDLKPAAPVRLGDMFKHGRWRQQQGEPQRIPLCVVRQKK